MGLGTQSVLWSDARVFAAHSETEGNLLMYEVTKKALQLIEGKSFVDPVTLQDTIFNEVYQFSQNRIYA